MQTQILKSLNKKDSKAIETLQIQKSVICQSNLLNLFKKELVNTIVVLSLDMDKRITSIIWITQELENIICQVYGTDIEYFLLFYLIVCSILII